MTAALWLTAPVLADWRAETAPLLRPEGDIRLASQALLEAARSGDASARPTICALLGYVFSQLGDKPAERAWIAEFFEKYRGMGTELTFLDEVTRARVASYLSGWFERYPLISDIFFLKSADEKRTDPPPYLVLGVEMANEAYYKLSDGKRVVSGSLFRKGVNAVPIESGSLLTESGRRTFALEVKAGDIVVDKEFVIDVRIVPLGIFSTEKEAKHVEYSLSLFIEDRLLFTSRKSQRVESPYRVELPDWVYRPYHFDPQKRFDPMTQSVSIPAMVQAASELLKTLTGGREEKKSGPERTERTDRLGYTLRRRDAAGRERVFRMSVTLELRSPLP